MRATLLIYSLLITGFLQGCGKHGSDDIYSAADRGDVAAVTRFLESGIDPNKPDEVGRVPLFFAASRPGNVAVVDVLVRHGAKVNLPDGSSILCGDAATVARLLDAGANVNGHAPGKDPPIVGIAGDGNGAAVEMLLSHGADPNPPSVDDMIDYVVGGDHTDVLRMLFNSGTRLGADKGRMALSIAVKHGNEQAVDLLLKAGGDARYRDPQGCSLIFLAMHANYHRFAIVKALLAAGADPLQANNAGETPLQWCRQTVPDDGTLALLESKGAH